MYRSKGSLALILPTAWAPSAYMAADGHTFRSAHETGAPQLHHMLQRLHCRLQILRKTRVIHQKIRSPSRQFLIKRLVHAHRIRRYRALDFIFLCLAVRKNVNPKLLMEMQYADSTASVGIRRPFRILSMMG